MKNKKFKFSLFENAIDSIERAIEILAWQEGSFESSRSKQVILLITHAVELLLKERLRRIHPSLIWEDIDKYPNIEARTVGIDKAITRLRNIGNIRIKNNDLNIIKKIKNTRNTIEHFEWEISKEDASDLIFDGLSLALNFSKEFLSFDIFYQKFRDDDTFHSLLKTHPEFEKRHKQNSNKIPTPSSLPLQECRFCNAIALDTLSGACKLCGQNNSNLSLGNNIPF